MKMIKTLVLFFLFCGFNATAQEMPTEGLPTATINNALTVTLDETAPLSPYYRVDISALSFENEANAKKQFSTFVSGNLIRNEVHYSDQFMIIHIRTEHLPEGATLAELQSYLNNKGRSLE